MALYQIGPLTVDVTPFNFDAVEHEVGSDYAAKEIVGAQKPREFVGEADTRITFEGKLFPHVLGGLDELQTLSELAKGGAPQMVIRGDGFVFGWFLIEKLTWKATTLNQVGVGRQYEVKLQIVKSPDAASAADMASIVFGLFS